jgi:hypothetical protein
MKLTAQKRPSRLLAQETNQPLLREVDARAYHRALVGVTFGVGDEVGGVVGYAE